MSYCACSTWPEYQITTPGGTVRTIPAGTVDVLRPTSRLVAALLLADREAALTAASQTGIQPTVAGPLWDAMTDRTEPEAVRVIADRDLRRNAAARGVAFASVTGVGVHEATGLLDPVTAALPATRRWRNCWRRVGAGVPAVDMPLARTQRMNEVRAARVPRLANSDLEVLRAQESADRVMQNKLKTYRQQLRDLPAAEQPSVDALTTPEQLADWEPTWPIDPTV